MQSKNIIIKLIDEHLISGEEAYELINDIIRGELYSFEKLMYVLEKASEQQFKWMNQPYTSWNDVSAASLLKAE